MSETWRRERSVLDRDEGDAGSVKRLRAKETEQATEQLTVL